VGFVEGILEDGGFDGLGLVGRSEGTEVVKTVVVDDVTIGA